jgi:hypothetical protein
VPGNGRVSPDRVLELVLDDKVLCESGHHRWATGPPNKELKLTKPSIMELRSLTPVFDRPMWTHEGKIGC